MLKDKISKAQVADRLGVSRTAVGKWWATFVRDGMKGIAAKPRHGAAPKLSPTQLRELPKLLEKGAGAFGFSGELWTTARVVKLIEQRFGVRYDRDHISRVLRQLGLSWQKPSKRAAERDEKAVRQWLKNEWPRIKKTPRAPEPS